MIDRPLETGVSYPKYARRYSRPMHRRPDTQGAAFLRSAALATCTVIDLCYLPPDAMYQIVFNEISAAEMAKIPKKLQLELLAEFQFLPDNLDHLDSKAFGVIEREGKKLYRYRASDYRIYFARTADGILVHRVLHKNTIGDFLFRSKLPLAEDEQLEQSSGFWKLIEEGERTKNER